MPLEEIRNEDELYRRVPDYWVKENGNISSAAFQNTSDTDEMSVDLARLTTPVKASLNNPKFGVTSIIAGYVRQLEQKVYHEPIVENPAHSTVKGKKTRGIMRSLAKNAKLILPPLGIPINTT